MKSKIAVTNDGISFFVIHFILYGHDINNKISAKECLNIKRNL